MNDERQVEIARPDQLRLEAHVVEDDFRAVDPFGMPARRDLGRGEGKKNLRGSFFLNLRRGDGEQWASKPRSLRRRASRDGRRLHDAAEDETARKTALNARVEAVGGAMTHMTHLTHLPLEPVLRAYAFPSLEKCVMVRHASWFRTAAP